MIEEAEAEAAQLREERLAEAEETIETRRQDVLAEGERERDRLVERAEGRTEDVIEYVVDAFEEAVHAQA
jgi:V/A-type H+-transporting ATPase subunit G/H